MVAIVTIFIVTLVQAILVGKSEIILHKLYIKDIDTAEVGWTRAFTEIYYTIGLLEVMLLAWSINKI